MFLTQCTSPTTFIKFSYTKNLRIFYKCSREGVGNSRRHLRGSSTGPRGCLDDTPTCSWSVFPCPWDVRGRPRDRSPRDGDVGPEVTGEGGLESTFASHPTLHTFTRKEEGK